MNRIYNIFLDDESIGTTRFEKADAPMGVVFGEIIFEKQNINYDLIKDYCKLNNIELADDSPEDRIISTMTINSLRVENEKGIEVEGVGNQISGMDSDVFEITVLGISYPFYGEEFPQHVKAYHKIFKEGE